MNEICEKLPAINSIVTYNNDYKKFLDSAYKTFCSIFDKGNVEFKGLPVYINRELNYNLQLKGFEHVTTMDTNQKRRQENIRLYNEKRIERVAWIKYLISGADCEQDCSNYRIFNNMRNNKQRVIIWCKREDYIIVLENRKTNYFLITAYCVFYDYARVRLEHEYKAFLNKNENARR